MSKPNPLFIIFIICLIILILNYRLLFNEDIPVIAKEPVCIKEYVVNISYKYNTEDLKQSLINSWSSYQRPDPIQLYTPRNFTSRTAIVIFCLRSSNQEDLIASIRSVVLSSSRLEKFDNAVVVVFEEEFSEPFLISNLLDDFIYEVQLGFLQFFRVGAETYSDYFKNAQIKMHNIIDKETFEGTAEFNRPLETTFSMMRMLFKAGDHFKTSFEHLLFTDEYFEVLTASPFKLIEKHLAKPYNSWSVIDFSDHLNGKFLGKMIHSNEVFKFAFYYLYYFSENINDVEMCAHELLQVHLKYIKLTYQANPIVVRPLLMIPRRMVSMVEGKSREQMVADLYQGKVVSDDPMAAIVTNMEAKDVHHHAQMMYSTLGEYHFHAVSPRVFDWLVFVFDVKIRLEKIIVITGQNSSLTPLTTTQSFDQVQSSTTNPANNEVYESYSDNFEVDLAVLETSPKLLKFDPDHTVAKCADYQWVGNVGGSETRLEGLSHRIRRPTKCLKLTLTAVHNITDIIIRQIAIYTI